MPPIAAATAVRTQSTTAARSFKPSPYVAVWARELTAMCRDQGVAAMCVLEAANGKVDKWAFDYETGKPKEANLVRAPADHVLNLTALVNVSGHTGQVELYANDPNQTFNVSVTGPDGATQAYKIARTKPKGAEYVAKLNLKLDVSKPGTYVISGWPEGSGGAGGYVEGRQYRLHVGKENFFNPSGLTQGGREL